MAKKKSKSKRNDDLRTMLIERRDAMQAEVHSRIREGRSDARGYTGDALEHSDAAIQGDIERSLLQMRAETVSRVEAALVRLDAGKYGSCFECEDEISEPRLRALPFAVRCQKCEEKREEQLGKTQLIAQRRGGGSLFSDVLSS